MNRQEQDRILLGKVITKAWHDSAFEKRFLEDPETVLKEEGFDIPQGLEVRVLKNTASVVNIVIPDKPAVQTVDYPPDTWKVAGCNCWQGEAWN